MKNEIIICPVCKGKMKKVNNSYSCDNSHIFDISKDGYVNLLLGSKSGDKRGDSKDSARNRHAFLKKDYYKPLKTEIVKRMSGTVLDICCGDGYYDEYDGILYGFDISKEMVRLASKNNKVGTYFVANLSHIPIKDGSVDTAVHLFAPFNDKEFSRVLKKSGTLFSVIPGKEHLIELKNAIYDTPYLNDEKSPSSAELELISTTRVKSVSTLSNEDLTELFSMTPYFYRTSDENKNRLNSIENLQITFDFIILEYKLKNKMQIVVAH